MTAPISVLADRINLGSYRGDSGMNFATRAQRTSKDVARGKVLRSLSGDSHHDKLRILTMPSLAWSLERQLVNNREHGKGLVRPRRTFVTAIERSTPIWTAALLSMPGREHFLSTAIPCPDFARAAARSSTIARFFLCDFEDFAFGTDYQHDAAWLDFSGPITDNRVAALRHLWESRLIESKLTVTSLAARWTQRLAADLADAGGITAYLSLFLIHAEVTDEHVYMDGVPMHQVSFQRVAA